MHVPLHKAVVLVCISMFLIVGLLSAIDAMDTASAPSIKKMIHRKRLASDTTIANNKHSAVKRDYDESYGMADAATGADSVYDLGQNCGFAPAWEVAGLPPPPDYSPDDCVKGGGGGDYESDGYDWSQADEEDYPDEEEVNEDNYDGDSYDTSYDTGDEYSPDPEPLLCIGICL